MASWRVAKSLEVLRDQVNKFAPDRDKSSDGTKGDDAHASRVSDHNPDSHGVVMAMDISHDPAHGVDSYAIAEQLRAARDSRIKYVISNKKIFGDEGYAKRNGKKAWEWSPYSGSNPHDKHIHISVNDAYDSTEPWAVNATQPHGSTSARSRIRKGDKGPDVEKLHKLLGLQPSSDFDGITELAVKHFQTVYGLVADGIVGPYTWEALEKAAKSGVDTTQNIPVRIFEDIKATVFDDMELAYGSVAKDTIGAALPRRFKNPPDLWIRNRDNGKSVIAKVVDVGPWNTDDPYWDIESRPQAESGKDKSGRETNGAGIDLLPATMRALGIPYTESGGRITGGEGRVDWGFADEIPQIMPTTRVPKVGEDLVAQLMKEIEPILRRYVEKGAKS